MLKEEDFRRVLAESGLKHVELAQLYGVTRQTIYYWTTIALPRKGSPMARMAEAITVALVSAIDRKVLPLPSTSKEVRAQRIARMTKTLQGLKPAPV